MWCFTHPWLWPSFWPRKYWIACLLALLISLGLISQPSADGGLLWSTLEHAGWVAGDSKLEWQRLVNLLQSISVCLHIQLFSFLQSYTTGVMLQKGKCGLIEHVQHGLWKHLPSLWSFCCIYLSYISSDRQCVCKGCFRLSSSTIREWRSCPSFSLISV